MSALWDNLDTLMDPRIVEALKNNFAEKFRALVNDQPMLVALHLTDAKIRCVSDRVIDELLNASADE